MRNPVLILVALWCAGLSAGGQFAKLSVPFDAFAAAYPDAGPYLGFMVSILSAMGVICGFFAGMLVSRLGYRTLLLGALWLGAGLSIAQAALPSWPAMMALRFVEGISHLIIVVAAPTLMAQLATDQARGAVMTIWSTFFGVAFALTAFLGMPLVVREGIWALLLAHGVFTAIVATLLTVMLKPLPKTARREGGLLPGPILRAHASAYRSPFLSAPALGWLCYTLTYVALLTVLPAQLPENSRDWASAIMPLAGLGVSLTLGIVLLRWFDGVRLCVLGFTLAIATALVLSAAPSSALLAVALMGCLGLVQSGSFAAIPQLAPNPADQAEANGAMAQMGNLGNLLGTPLMLSLVAWAGARAIFVGLVFAYGAGLGLHLLQAHRRRRAT